MVSKTLDNAYVLKSQKKTELCVAFFLLAKHYRDAIHIALLDLKNPQLAVLIYRVFEEEIRKDEEIHGEIK